MKSQLSLRDTGKIGCTTMDGRVDGRVDGRMDGSGL
jgi:hypothetical protein